MISIILNILFYGLLGSGTVGIGVGVYSKYGILGIIRLLLVIFAVPAWLYAIYRLFGNFTHVMNNHLQGAGEGLFSIPFVISIVVIVITSLIGAVLHSINEEEKTNNKR